METLKAALGGASCFDGYSKYIDLSIYCSHPFRLPNQTNLEKPLKHVIKRGEMIDFFVHYTENATEEPFYGCILPHTCVYRIKQS